MKKKLSRRRFLKLGGAALATGAIVGSGTSLALRRFQVVSVTNPLEDYPNRDWETVYRDQYAYDDSFTFVCSPNDTHACRLRAFTRNGIVSRIEQNYDSGRLTGLDEVKATEHWNPRGCSKGLTMHRRVYGPYRLQHPMVRAGWKQWADDGFPELTPDNRDKYKFTSRGQDTFERLSWDETYDYATRGMIAIAEAYSGEEGAQRLRDEGYQPEMIDEMHGAGTRTIKLRGGMGLLGVIGKYGMYRFANMLALLDSHVRGIDPDDALGGRNWMPDTHFFYNTMERGAKIVVISPEYGPQTTKADYWLSVRPGISDTTIFLAVSKIIMDNGWHDEEFVKQFTDLPLLVRTDNLKR
ncbi:MAG: nitrate oxidoreductase subunit alpha, partial [Dehalococcoidia bacterium]